MRGSTSPSKQVVKFSIMPLASRRLDGETDGTTINQQSAPRSCVNPGWMGWSSGSRRGFGGSRRAGGFESIWGHLTICSKLHVKQDWCRSCENVWAPEPRFTGAFMAAAVCRRRLRARSFIEGTYEPAARCWATIRETVGWLTL